MEYRAWLIETHVSGLAKYAYDDHEAPRLLGWTDDANKALHFSRESDACSAIELLNVNLPGSNLNAFASEHCWPDGL